MDKRAAESIEEATCRIWLIFTNLNEFRAFDTLRLTQLVPVPFIKAWKLFLFLYFNFRLFLLDKFLYLYLNRWWFRRLFFYIRGVLEFEYVYDIRLGSLNLFDTFYKDGWKIIYRTKTVIILHKLLQIHLWQRQHFRLVMISDWLHFVVSLC